MHLWHKWKTVRTSCAVATLRQTWTRPAPAKVQVIGELQRCAKCGAERGVLHFPNGDALVVHAAFITESRPPLV